MTIYSASDLLTKPVHMGGYGDATVASGSVTLTSALTTSDKVRVCRIPAGMKVNALIVSHGDLDTGTGTLVANVGYEPVDSNLGPTANASYFASADTGFAAPSSGRVLAGFDPIKFEQDVYLIVTPTANANAMTSGQKLRVSVIGTAEGVA